MLSASRQPASPDRRVAVIGAGVVGLVTALELRARGAEVVVYDSGADLGAGATIRSAGMLGAAFEWALHAHERSISSLSRHAGRLWPDLAARIERLAGGGIEFSAEGALVIAASPAERDWTEGLAAACQAQDIAVERLSAGQMAAREPGLGGGLYGGLLLPGDRQVDASLLLQRLAAALRRQGVALRLARPVERMIAGAGFQTPDAERFSHIILATGAGPLPDFLGPDGGRIRHGLPPTTPVKGQMLALAPAPGAPRRVIHGRDIYIAPKARWILVGATTERDRSDSRVERAAIEDLRARAARLCPALAQAPELTSWAGVRPGSGDDRPLIGPTAIPGVFAALGHYRNGVLLAPATAELIADQVIDGKVSPLAAAFDPLRFDKDGPAPHSPFGAGLLG